jgi:hypothetical protein
MAVTLRVPGRRGPAMRVRLDFAGQSKIALQYKVNEGADMNERVAMRNGADPDEGTGMDTRAAAAILQQARERAEHELRVSYRLLFVTYGLLYLIGYGTVWLSVRGQRPYHGPGSAALVVLTLLVAAAVIVTVIVVGRAFAGVGGWSARQRRVALLSYAIAIAGVYLLEAALFHAGASWSVIGIYGATAPMLVTGMAYAFSSAFVANWSVFGLGIWLIIVAATSAFAGPVGVWAVGALAAGLAFLLVAAVRPGQRD